MFRICGAAALAASVCACGDIAIDLVPGSSGGDSSSSAGGSSGSGGSGGSGGDVAPTRGDQELIHKANTFISALVCDGEQLYWAQPNQASIMTARIDGKGLAVLAKLQTFSTPIVYAHEGYVYFAGVEDERAVYRVDSESGSVELVADTGTTLAFFVDAHGTAYWAEEGRIMSTLGVVVTTASAVRDLWVDDTGVYWSDADGAVMRSAPPWVDQKKIGAARTTGSGFGIVHHGTAVVVMAPDGPWVIPDSGADQYAIGVGAHSVSSTAAGATWVSRPTTGANRVLSLLADDNTSSEEIASGPDIESAAYCAGHFVWWTTSGQIWRRKWSTN